MLVVSVLAQAKVTYHKFPSNRCVYSFSVVSAANYIMTVLFTPKRTEVTKGQRLHVHTLVAIGCAMFF